MRVIKIYEEEAKHVYDRLRAEGIRWRKGENDGEIVCWYGDVRNAFTYSIMGGWCKPYWEGGKWNPLENPMGLDDLVKVLKGEHTAPLAQQMLQREGDDFVTFLVNESETKRIQLSYCKLEEIRKAIAEVDRLMKEYKEI